MVILGGLEIVAAGYVLNELSKDNKKSQRPSSQPAQHRRKRRDSSNSHRPRPSQQNLMPPQSMAPSRPTSAPPQQFGPPRISSEPPVQGNPVPGSHLGPSWMNPNRPFTPAPQAQTWPHPQHQQHQQHQQYQQHQQQYQQHQQHQQQPLQPSPPPYQAFSQSTPQLSSFSPNPAVPQHSAYAGTVSQMYFDTKTGKWQSGMLPAEMPGSNTREISDDRGSSRRRGRSRRQRAYSSGSDGYSDENSGLAYGSLPRDRPSRY